MAEYKLSLTASEIDNRLKKVGQLSDDVGGLQNLINNKQDKINGNAGDFVVIGEDGNVTTKTIAYAEGVSF